MGCSIRTVIMVMLPLVAAVCAEECSARNATEVAGRRISHRTGISPVVRSVHTDLMSANRVFDRTVGRVQRLCASPMDERSLRAAVLLELQRTIGFDYYAWLLTDPVT